MSKTELQDRVWAWARGSYPLEAGVELLIRQGKAIYEGAPWIKPTGDRSWIDVDELIDGTGAWSGGEQRVVRIAASLLGGPAVDLNEDIPGLDRSATVLVLAAIAHANGSHEHSEMVFDENGTPKAFRHASSLYPWPELEPSV